ncbi:MAG TPA: protein translocase subunit SecD [Bryobacteraceae bacterium]|jgi:preprotein translocase subunit SecD|nr:protein translocase subunit SecD [Bryobacteraceae bacterium]
MTSNLRFRAISIVVIILICVYGIIGLPTSKADLAENWRKNIRLGLDLKGGSQLMLQVQLQDAFKATADQIIQKLKEELPKAGIQYVEMVRNDPQTLTDGDKIQIDIKGIDATKAGNFRQIIQENFGVGWILTPVNSTDYRMTIQATEALKLRADTLTQSIATIDKKINGLGLSESTVQQRGGSASDAEILVQLPGVDDPARVKQLLKTQAVLELREVKTGPFGSDAEARASKGGVLGLDEQVVRGLSRGAGPAEFWILARTPVVTGRDLRDARPQQSGQTGGWETTFVLTQESAKRFERFTAAHINDRLAIVLDRMVLSAPVIHGKISDNGVIEGLSGREEAQDLALNLRAGSLPAGIEVLEERTVGPSLGADSIKNGTTAGIAGVAVVVAFMLFYYKRSGINATLALILNALILIAALSYFDAVLTLPGIAGVILTIGMAVDSNVLIFERIREELRAGKAVIAAVDAGFKKAFLTIIDTHVTTVVSCAILFLFGTGPVKGFAVTLVIGLLANVFTAVFVSRTIFDWELGMQKKAVTLSI